MLGMVIRQTLKKQAPEPNGPNEFLTESLFPIKSIQNSDDHRVQLVKSMGFRAYACNPLLAGNRLLGTLSFASRTRDRLEDDELDFLRTLCHYAAAAYERVGLISQLRAADRRKDEFLATLAHELRNPLAPIRNSLHLLRLAGGSGEGAERVYEMMERQVGQMVRLVDDLLEVSRISRGKIGLRKERIDLAAVVASAVETSRPLIEAARHRLSLALPTPPLILEADPMRLAQVIANLLNNAAKYTEEGGQIWLSAKREGNEAVVSVRDNGLGIRPDMLPRVFDLFAQADRTIQHSQGGMGIGLTLVRSLVQMHGGRVEAKSEGPGRGSEFVMHLPLKAEHRPEGEDLPQVNSQQAALLPRRVLVVDDNHDAADSLGMLLTFLGADVQVVYDGLAALEAIRGYRPAVVLLDLDMPGADGYQVARQIRQAPGLQATTLIALTGWGKAEDSRRSLQAGFDYHLVKPVDVEAVQALLTSLPSQPRIP
jgi:signal transduction histidine kinase/ActR/RegA family two-component response regulator